MVLREGQTTPTSLGENLTLEGREFVAVNDMIPQRFAVHHDSQPLRQRECAAQLSVDHKLSQTPVGEAGSAYAHAKGVHFPWWRHKTMDAAWSGSALKSRW